MAMFYRLSALAVVSAAIGALIWNGWFREDLHGDSIVGAAWLTIYVSAAILFAALFVVLFPGYRPQDRYWGYATLGLVIGFWLQR